jgi:hypothetical protein
MVDRYADAPVENRIGMGLGARLERKAQDQGQ